MAGRFAFNGTLATTGESDDFSRQQQQQLNRSIFTVCSILSGRVVGAPVPFAHFVLYRNVYFNIVISIRLCVCMCARFVPDKFRLSRVYATAIGHTNILMVIGKHSWNVILVDLFGSFYIVHRVQNAQLYPCCCYWCYCLAAMSKSHFIGIFTTHNPALEGVVTELIRLWPNVLK